MSLPTNKLNELATLDSKMRIMSIDERHIVPKTPKRDPKRSRREEQSPRYRKPGQDKTNERAIESVSNSKGLRKSVFSQKESFYLEQYRRTPQLSLEQIWGIIIRHAADPKFVLDKEQVRRTLEYGSDSHTLAEEMDLRAKGKSHQIWRILESTGCLSYTI
jgi:hypothetical protein